MMRGLTVLLACEFKKALFKVTCVKGEGLTQIIL